MKQKPKIKMFMKVNMTQTHTHTHTGSETKPQIFFIFLSGLTALDWVIVLYIF